MAFNFKHAQAMRLLLISAFIFLSLAACSSKVPSTDLEEKHQDTPPIIQTTNIVVDDVLGYVECNVMYSPGAAFYLTITNHSEVNIDVDCYGHLFAVEENGETTEIKAASEPNQSLTELVYTIAPEGSCSDFYVPYMGKAVLDAGSYKLVFSAKRDTVPFPINVDFVIQ